MSADDDDDDGTDRERTSDDDDDDAGNVAITRKKEEIQVEFDFEAPDEIDFQGLKSLLTPYLDGTEWQVGTLCDAIIGQFWCGNVVKPEDSLDPVAIVTALNLRFFRSVQPCASLEDIYHFLRRHTSDSTIRKSLEDMFHEDDSRIALLLNDRLINVPGEVSAPLYALLLSEMTKGSQDDELTAEGRKAMQNEGFLLVTRVWVEDSDDHEGGKAPRGHTALGRGGDGGGGGKEAAGSALKKHPAVTGLRAPPVHEGSLPFSCLRPEDEFLWRRCTWAFAFAEANRVQKRGEPRAVRLAMLVSRGALEGAAEELYQNYGRPEMD